MIQKLHYKLLLVALTIGTNIFAQIPTDSWRDHLPYSEGVEVAIAKNKIYCATTSAMFYVDKDDYSINRLNPINGLTDLGIGSIAYSDEHDVLVVGYTNGNIDLITEKGLINLSDLKSKNIIANKSINKISIFGDFAYLACGFGIVVLNIPREEISDTYIIGPNSSYLNINYVGILNQEIIALSEHGIYKADKNSGFLSYYENWSLDTTIANYNHEFLEGTVVHNKLYVANESLSDSTFMVYSYENTTWDLVLNGDAYLRSLSSENNALNVSGYYGSKIYNANLEIINVFEEHDVSYTLLDEEGTIWASKMNQGLVSVMANGTRKNYLPNGPKTKDAFAMALNRNEVLVARGGYSSTSTNTWTQAQFYQFAGERWKNYTSSDNFLKERYDAVCFGTNDQSGNYYCGTWSYGLLEIQDNEIVNTYNEDNSDSTVITLPRYYSGISGLAHDRYGNLWMMQRNLDIPVAVKTADGKWYKHQYGSAMSKTHTGKLIYTNGGDFWTISRKNGTILVWNDPGTPDNSSDDIYKYFNFRDSDGAKISDELLSIVEDREGAIWVGSSNGVGVYYNPNNVLNGRDFHATLPLVTDDGYNHNLLEGNTITDIVVDGGNRKWIATGGGGLFLVSASGTEQIMNLNTSNSPLYSNNILSLAFNEENGELFVGTDKGILSYMTSSSGGRSDLNNIYAFPNPVRPDYTGLITIRGLIYETQVKITDIAGKIVFEGESQGGDLVWNGLDLSDNKVHSGVYIVLCSNKDGSMAEATKILFIR